MPGLILFHLFQNQPAFLICLGQQGQVFINVRFHLVFRLYHKTKAPLVTTQAGYGTQCEGTQVPDRIQIAGMAVQGVQAIGTPGQVIGLFIGGLLHHIAYSLLPCDKGLAVIQALGGNFAGVIHPHESGSMALFTLIQRGLLDIRSRRRTGY